MREPDRWTQEPDDAVALQELRALAAKSKQLAARDEWGDEALAVNERIAGLCPSADGALLRIGECHFRNARWKNAEAYFRRVLESSKDDLRRKVAARKLSECVGSGKLAV